MIKGHELTSLTLVKKKKKKRTVNIAYYEGHSILCPHRLLFLLSLDIENLGTFMSLLCVHYSGI